MDELLVRTRAAGLNVSRAAAAALAQELDRRARIAELDRCLRELEVELGPITPDEAAAARDWADGIGSEPTARSNRRSRRTA